ncbi:hypothetical protein [Parabacteroides provencensis]|uniref:hypothetical protein n=1 Tax=Parabacteroides provencensis TaxID=1944636 RepID=UPI000C15C6E1|nr:hypothetical protein [Parabacteroides provencensis]
MNWTETETIITICTGIVTLTQFFLWKYFACNKSYELEKGKNIATKEDIREITKEIESVKSYFNQELENHKIKLLKDFESSKNVIDICNKIDTQLLRLLIECQYNIFIDYENYHNDLETNRAKNSIIKLGIYLIQYKSRYDNNLFAKEIIEGYKKLNDFYEYCDYIQTFEEPEYIKIIEFVDYQITMLLCYFLPKL